MTESGQKFLLNVAMAILVAAIMAAIIGGVKKFPDIRADYLESQRRAEIYDLSGVKGVIGFHAKMDRLLAFVHENSVHKIDGEFWDDFRNKPRTLDKFVAYAKKKSMEKPHMECSTRSKLLLPLVRKAGFEAHMVDMFKHTPGFDSHTAIEVKNPATGDWEFYDPTFQIYWKNDKTGQRASVEDLVMNKQAHFTPCHAEGACGYNVKGHDQPADRDVFDYFGYAVRMNDDGMGYEVFHSPERFSLDQKPKKGKQVFCEWAGKRWCPQ